jgi:hypothetical protein
VTAAKVKDLDAAVAAALGDPRRYKLAGRTFTLPARLPLGVAAAIGDQDFTLLADVLAGGNHELKVHLLAHLTDLHLEEIARDYGLAPGESAASAG